MKHSFSQLAVIYLSAFEFTSASEYTPCPNSCSSNGLCSRPWGVCECFDGFTGKLLPLCSIFEAHSQCYYIQNGGCIFVSGPDCSLRTCPFGTIAWADSATATDSAHHGAECSHRGKCDRVLGECICGDGFEGESEVIEFDFTSFTNDSASCSCNLQGRLVKDSYVPTIAPKKGGAFLQRR